ncbi:unnamed protein product [Clonostachys rosea f. rosea IK726]|jgi:hypothetical protein|uniref:Uncharacterized protein n=1 Tax=Clonostachys rosea f. rosea IK726 TaxID=1349383 RepID=A0ACA9UUY7_BIOOC|nr:unnamed protein product [Clonostachys rosea f. rosea IK726]
MHFSHKLNILHGMVEARPASTLQHPIPPVLQGFYQRKLVTGTFHLGETSDHPLYAVSVQSGWGCSPPGVTLHSGPTNKHPVLAKAADETGSTHNALNSVIQMPPLPGAHQASVENLHAAVDRETATFQFSVDVGYAHDLRREFFEWRKIETGHEMGILPPQFESGFKLVRMGSGGVFRQPEVVATIAFYDGRTMTLPFILQFHSSLGDRWAIMVIVTALKIWALNIQGKATASYISAQGDGWVTGASG